MKTVRYDPDAADELLDEVARYELRRDGLGIEFIVAVREAEQLIAHNPGGGNRPSNGAVAAAS